MSANVNESKKNPYSPLIRMCELRLARQEQALSETRLQLEAAQKASMGWNEEQLKAAKR